MINQDIIYIIDDNVFFNKSSAKSYKKNHPEHKILIGKIKITGELV